MVKLPSPLFVVLTISTCAVIVTRESLWRLCGYGSTSADRYLDDQVRPAVTILMFVVNKKKLVQAVNALLGLLVQDQVQFTGAPV